MLLDAGANVNAKDNHGKPALIWASIRGDTETVTMLLEKGADVNAKDKVNHDTALIEASSKGYTEIVSMLLENGADVNAKTKYGMTALNLASQSGPTELVVKLLDAGADVNAKTRWGMTALDGASHYGNTEIVKLLKKQIERNALTGVAIRLANTPITSTTTNEEYVTRQVLCQSVNIPDGKRIRPLTKEIGSYLGGKRKTKKRKTRRK